MSDLVRIITLNDIGEASLIDSILQERRIPHLVLSHYDSAYDGVFKITRGWGHLEAPEENRAEIAEICADVRRSREKEVSGLGTGGAEL